MFSAEEMSRIFEAADDMILDCPNSKATAEFPMLLRILYGCGLRLGEATALTWDDIDLDTGVITVKYAKGLKQRIIPMGDELARILRLYHASPHFESDDRGYLFRKKNGDARSGASNWGVFNTILCDLGIKNSQSVRHGTRGPCIHSLRHTFTLNSLLKAEAEGRTFIETVPFLSTYLGHDGLMQTDVYLKARHELYTASHSAIEDYAYGVFPDDVFPEDA